MQVFLTSTYTLEFNEIANLSKLTKYKGKERRGICENKSKSDINGCCAKPEVIASKMSALI